MWGAYYVITALLVVASSQIAAESSHNLHAYDHDVIASGNAVVKSLPKRLQRGSRDVHDDLANEERSFFPTWATLIEEGVRSMSRTAEAVEGATEAGKEMPLVAGAGMETPRAAESVKKLPPAANSEPVRAKKGAKAALEKHLQSFSNPAAIGDVSRYISGQEIIRIPEWNIDLVNIKPLVVLHQHEGKIDPIRKAFAEHCAPDLNPTAAETSNILSSINWRIAKNAKAKHRQNLMAQAKRQVLTDLSDIASHVYPLWQKWETLSTPVKNNVLNILLNLHYQRWVRLFNTFEKHRSEIINLPSKLKFPLGDDIGTSNALARFGRFQAPESYPSEPLYAATTSKGDRSVFTQRSKRTYDGTTSLPSKQPKMRGSKSFTPLLTKSTTLSDHSVPTKKLRASFGGASSALAPHKQPEVHNSKSLAPASAAMTLKDSDTTLSLGGIYDKNTG